MRTALCFLQFSYLSFSQFLETVMRPDPADDGRSSWAVQADAVLVPPEVSQAAGAIALAPLPQDDRLPAMWAHRTRRSAGGSLDRRILFVNGTFHKRAPRLLASQSSQKVARRGFTR
jgi:hypothetical protein